MATHRHHIHRKLDHKTPGFGIIYPLSMVFVFHLILVAYINSTFMEQYVSTEGVGLLFSISSALAILIFLFFSYALRAIGNVKLTLILATLDCLSLVVMGFTETAATAIIAFVVFLTVNPIIFLNIDIFSESLIGEDESATGSKRGLVLALMGLVGVLGPLVTGYIASTSEGEGLRTVYYAAAISFLPFIMIILFKFKNFVDPEYHSHKVTNTLYKLWHVADIRNVLLAHLTLQMFFAWATIYIPLYLATELNYSWEAIGSIMAVALLGYVVIEYPAGYAADKWWGEKELMAIGFLILALATASIAFAGVATVATWMLIMFMTRVGAALVEATTESYFFKHTQGGDAEVISFFRLLRPLARLIGALLGAVAILYLPFNLIFIVLAFAMVPGIFFTIALHDTK